LAQWEKETIKKKKEEKEEMKERLDTRRPSHGRSYTWASQVPRLYLLSGTAVHFHAL
jgi:hypothetical protein